MPRSPEVWDLSNCCPQCGYGPCGDCNACPNCKSPKALKVILPEFDSDEDCSECLSLGDTEITLLKDEVYPCSFVYQGTIECGSSHSILVVASIQNATSGPFGCQDKVRIEVNIIIDTFTYWNYAAILDRKEFDCCGFSAILEPDGTNSSGPSACYVSGGAVTVSGVSAGSCCEPEDFYSFRICDAWFPGWLTFYAQGDYEDWRNKVVALMILTKAQAMDLCADGVGGGCDEVQEFYGCPRGFEVCLVHPCPRPEDAEPFDLCLYANGKLCDPSELTVCGLYDDCNDFLDAWGNAERINCCCWACPCDTMPCSVSVTFATATELEENGCGCCLSQYSGHVWTIDKMDGCGKFLAYFQSPPPEDLLCGSFLSISGPGTLNGVLQNWTGGPANTHPLWNKIAWIVEISCALNARIVFAKILGDWDGHANGFIRDDCRADIEGSYQFIGFRYSGSPGSPYFLDASEAFPDCSIGNITVTVND